MRALAAELVDAIAGPRARPTSTRRSPSRCRCSSSRSLLGLERDEVFWEWTDTLMYGRVQGASEADILARRARALRLPRGADRRPAARDAGRRPRLAARAAARVGDRPYREDEILDLCFFLLIAGPGEHRASASGRRCGTSPCGASTARPCWPTRRWCTTWSSSRCASTRPSPPSPAPRPATPRSAGQRIAAGERILLLFGSANRDGEVFPEADEFHLDRRDGRHVAFGIGPHRCVGSHLARLEMRVAIEELLRRVPALSGWRTGPTRAGTRPARCRWSGTSRRAERGARREGRGRPLDVRGARAVLRHLPDGVRQRRARLRGRARRRRGAAGDEQDARSRSSPARSRRSPSSTADGQPARRATTLAYAMWPKNAPASERRRASALSAARARRPARPAATRRSAPRSISARK